MSIVRNLLIEDTHYIEVLTENGDSGKQLYIHGVMAQAEIKNGNGRIYKREILENAVNIYNEKYVKTRQALGQLNHPNYPFPDPAEAAIRITEIEMQGNDVIGKALVLNTPKGQIIKGLLEGGFALGVSTRGLGSLVEKNGSKHVQDDFMMTAIDAVYGPSGPDCYVNQLSEQINEWVNRNGVWMPASMDEQTNPISEEFFLDRFEQFIKAKIKNQ